MEKQNENESSYPKGNPFAINFTSADQLIHYPMVCYDSDNFSKIEEELFTEFPELKKKKNLYYIANGGIVDRSATIEKNKIKKGTNILINYSD